MQSLKEVLQILVDKLEEDKRDRTLNDGGNDLLYVLTHILEQSYLDAAFEKNSSDGFEKSFDIAMLASRKFVDEIIHLSTRL